MRQACTPMTAHDDQVYLLGMGQGENFLKGRPEDDHSLARQTPIMHTLGSLLDGPACIGFQLFDVRSHGWPYLERSTSEY
jgi:hypothetical protein